MPEWIHYSSDTHPPTVPFHSLKRQIQNSIFQQIVPLPLQGTENNVQDLPVGSVNEPSLHLEL